VRFIHPCGGFSVTGSARSAELVLEARSAMKDAHSPFVLVIVSASATLIE
jgi:hypothetical protein